LSGALSKLGEPLANLDMLKGLPPELIRRCQVTVRGQEALELVPEALRREWSDGAVQKWIALALKTDHRESPAATKSTRPHARQRAKRAPDLGHHSRINTEAFALLLCWIRAMRPMVPSDNALQETIIDLVHGSDADLPPDPVGAALRQIVPRLDEIESGRKWALFEELGATMDLEKQYCLRSQYGIGEADLLEFHDVDTATPLEVRRRRPLSASAVRGGTSNSSGKIDMSFPQAYRNIGGGGISGTGMRITASRMEPWTMGQMPRTPRTGEVPGPGFYHDRSLQRAIKNPNNGEFCSVGKLRTCCSLNSVSVTTRFGQADLTRLPSATRRRKLCRPDSAPSIGRTAAGQDRIWEC
jgi:hypothetical protein